MAKVNNPRKHFQFNILVPGLNPFLCQEVKMPDVDYDSTPHGDTNFEVKTAGMKKIGTLQITKICPADAPDRFVWNWFSLIGNTLTGGGALPSVYKKSIIIEQLGPDGFSVLQRWEWHGAWPRKINGVEFSRTSSANTVEVIEFEVDEDDN